MNCRSSRIECRECKDRVWLQLIGVVLMVLTSASNTHAQRKRAATDQIKPIIIARQGSFSVGGREVSVPGTFDSSLGVTSHEGEIFQIDQMYVQFQIPPNARKFPIVLIHGGFQTGKSWESTPDGREGYQSIFLRKGYAVYIVDLPRRGRAGFPSFNGPLGNLAGRQIMRDQTSLFGAQQSFIRFRLGPKFMQYYPNSQFPKDGLDQFLKQAVPAVTVDDSVVTSGLVALLDRIGPAILVSHSQSGRFSFLAAMQSPKVVGIVDYEGSNHAFPANETPDALKLYDGKSLAPGASVPLDDFLRLTRIPIQIVQGDNIPTEPVPNVRDRNRVRAIYQQQLVNVINAHGGKASLLRLRDAGLQGNTHFSFADLNNADVAELLSQFLHENRLDIR